MRKRNVIFVLNCFFVVYIGIDRVENEFFVFFFGSRNFLRSEERSEEKSYYWFFEKVGLFYLEFVKLEEIDEVGFVIVKFFYVKKRFERGFFMVVFYREFREKLECLMKFGVIIEEDFVKVRIECYIIGLVFNFDFFYLLFDEEIEFFGIDWCFEMSFDGYVRFLVS